MAVKTITTSQVAKKKAASIPDEVLAAFNEVIAENWDGFSSTVLQKMWWRGLWLKVFLGIRCLTITGWMWKIYTGQRGGELSMINQDICESYDAYFTFRRK